LALLRDQSVAVLLCERDHADGNWEDLLKATASMPAPPNLIVFSRLADESFWAQVLNLGGFDVLMTPFEAEEVLRVIFAAWSHWECDFGARTAKEATRTGRPAAVKAAPPEEDLLPGGTGDTDAIIGARSRMVCMNQEQGHGLSKAAANGGPRK
jgi:DNA-binding NtrC family response regulator